MNQANQPKPRLQLGCGFIFITLGILLCLLLVNVWIVRNLGAETILAYDAHVFQAAQFVLPLLMIFVEYWIYDQVFTNRQLKRESD